MHGATWTGFKTAVDVEAEYLQKGFISDMEGMKEYRADIDRIDASLVKLLEERLDVVRKIGEYKAARGLPVFDAEREREKLAKIRQMADREENAEALALIFQYIMDVAKEAEHRIG